MSLKWTGCL
jgi:hypothetical protein